MKNTVEVPGSVLRVPPQAEGLVSAAGLYKSINDLVSSWARARRLHFDPLKPWRRGLFWCAVTPSFDEAVLVSYKMKCSYAMEVIPSLKVDEEMKNERSQLQEGKWNITDDQRFTIDVGLRNSCQPTHHARRSISGNNACTSCPTRMNRAMQANRKCETTRFSLQATSQRL